MTCLPTFIEIGIGGDVHTCIMACQFFVQSYVFKVYLYTLVCTVRRTCTIVGFLVNCLIGIHGCYVFTVEIDEPSPLQCDGITSQNLE